MSDQLKHNPAPWEYEDVQLRPEQSAYGVVKDANGKILFDSLNSDVAEIHEEESHRWDETGRRNLNLAARAPDLLAAAKAVLDGWYGTKGEVYGEDIRRLEEVVARVLGIDSYYAEWIRNLPPLPGLEGGQSPNVLATNSARSAWLLMLHHAMPARPAVNFVAEVTGNRPLALEMLLTQAVLDGANSRPSRDPSVPGSFADAEAGTIGGAIMLRQFDQAEDVRKKLAQRLSVIELAGDVDFAGPWLAWCTRAARAIKLCRALVAALAEEP